MTLVQTGDISDLIVTEGTYWCEDTVTGFPDEDAPDGAKISAGEVRVSLMDAGNTTYIRQELIGLLGAADKTLTKYERFVFANNGIANGIWTKTN